MNERYISRDIKDIRGKLFNVYAIISIIAMIAYWLTFTVYGLMNPAILQGIFLIPFVLAMVLHNQKLRLTAITIAILTSMTVVGVQTIGIFSKHAGFHYQLFPLMIVIFLVCDLHYSKDRIVAIVLSFIAAIDFIYCEYFTTEPLFDHNLAFDYTALRSSALAITFIATMIMLYVYSLELSRKEIVMNYLANHDGLTGIYNRSYFTKIGEVAYDQYHIDGASFSVILMDIDDFKNINDTYGHKAGDDCLVELARVVEGSISDQDIFARHGGEEFSVLIYNSTIDEAHKKAEELRIAISEISLSFNEDYLSFTTSMGVSTVKPDDKSFDAMMVSIDKALYQSKNEGKDKVTVA